MAPLRASTVRIPLAPALVAATLLAGCAGGVAPTLLTLQERTTGVNETLEFDVAATDPDTEVLTFSMRDAPKGATLDVVGGRLAKFRWTPSPAQAGLHSITFVASDGGAEDTETVNVRVASAGSPVWVTELPRIVVNPAVESVVKFVLEVKDDDSAEVFFEYDPHPEDWGASVVETGKRVVVNWQPDAEQKQQAQWSFRITAVDPDENRAETVVTIVFRGGTSDECPAGLALPEVVAEDVPDQRGEADYPLRALATDADSAIQSVEVAYTHAPDPKDGDWLLAPLRPVAGEEDAYEGAIPNAGLLPGESVRITWMICATDDDDKTTGDRCDGWTCTDPATFTASAALRPCDPCDSRGATDACPGGTYCELVDQGTDLAELCIPQTCSPGSTAPACTCSHAPPQPGELIVNEVLYDPASSCPVGMATCTTGEKRTLDVNGDGVRGGAEDDEEFVEILNASRTKTLLLEGVTLSDSRQVRFTFPAATLAPRESVVVFGGGDPALFTGLGGARAFAARLELTNSADTVKLKLGDTTLDVVQWTTGTVKDQSLVRSAEGARDAAMVAHGSAPGASGVKWSPGTHVCRAPFPLDPEACVEPVCNNANTNLDREPQSDARATASCLKSLPQTVSSRLSVHQPPPATSDTRDLYVFDGLAGKYVHARTEAGDAPVLNDTILRLLSRNGEELLKNDDDDWWTLGLYSRIVFPLPSDGLYFLEVTPYVTGETPTEGGYRLTVELTDTAPVRP